MRAAHGPVTARQSKTILHGALHLAVMSNVLGSNPVRDVQSIKSKSRPKGATALTGEQLRNLLDKLRVSELAARNHDLVDPITLLIATGLRESELLGLLWSDFNADAGTLMVTGKVGRAAGQGLQRQDTAKSEAGLRTLPLPRFAIDVLDGTAPTAVPRPTAHDLLLDGGHIPRSRTTSTSSGGRYATISARRT